jgi:hypothetical protein
MGQNGLCTFGAIQGNENGFIQGCGSPFSLSTVMDNGRLDFWQTLFAAGGLF